MKYLLPVLLLVAACATNQPRSERSVPQCLSLCNNNFATCSERHPGDYGACRQELQSCQTECEGQKAMERMEGDNEEVIAPTDSPDDEGMLEPQAEPDRVAPDDEPGPQVFRR